MSTHYDRVSSESKYQNAVKAQEKEGTILSFDQLEPTSASGWGLNHLLACRVVCEAPKSNLPLLSQIILNNRGREINHCILELINGPIVKHSELRGMAEPAIVDRHGNFGTGLIWTTLAPLLEQNTPQTQASTRPTRNAQRQFPDFVPSQTLGRSGSVPSGSESESESTVSSDTGFVQATEGRPLEDYTLEFFSLMTRFILDYSQTGEKRLPYVQFRKAKSTYKIPAMGETENALVAIDDGGIEYARATDSHVAIVEAKADFEAVRNGEPKLGDKVLAQVVAEAIALRLTEVYNPFGDSVVIIVPIKHYVKFFQLTITDDYLAKFRTVSPLDEWRDKASYLRVASTGWFNLTEKKGRKSYVKHIAALIDMADKMNQGWEV